jgi:hypothetical protein
VVVGDNVWDLTARRHSPILSHQRRRSAGEASLDRIEAAQDLLEGG